MDSLLKRFKRNKSFFFELVGVSEGSPGLGKGNPGWVPSGNVDNDVEKIDNGCYHNS